MKIVIGSRHTAGVALVWRGLGLIPVILALTAMSPTHRSAEPTSREAEQDTSLCHLISAKEFFAVLKAPVGSVQGRVGKIAGNVMVTCTYRPPGMRGSGGSITYVFPPNAGAYYAQLQEGDKSNLNKETNLTGVGDAAYWGTQVNSDEALELTMRKGKVVVALLFEGKASDGSAYLADAQQMAKSIAAHF